MWVNELKPGLDFSMDDHLFCGGRRRWCPSLHVDEQHRNMVHESEHICAQVCDDVAASRAPTVAAAASSRTSVRCSRRIFGMRIITVMLSFSRSLLQKGCVYPSTALQHSLRVSVVKHDKLRVYDLSVHIHANYGRFSSTSPARALFGG